MNLYTVKTCAFDTSSNGKHTFAISLIKDITGSFIPSDFLAMLRRLPHVCWSPITPVSTFSKALNIGSSRLTTTLRELSATAAVSSPVEDFRWSQILPVFFPRREIRSSATEGPNCKRGITRMSNAYINSPLSLSSHCFFSSSTLTRKLPIVPDSCLSSTWSSDILFEQILQGA